jgi:enolase-phosphatase E1
VAEPFSLAAEHIAIVLLDIEGTTTPIAFVHNVLFPYARARVGSFLESHGSDDDVRKIVEDLRTEQRSAIANSDERREATVVDYVHALMDRDRKSGPLKALQGRIWEQGYRDGELKGEVYPDVPTAFARWTADGLRIGIFSSGSVLAQQLLFANSTAGDLSRFLSCHFDTGVGAKGEAGSYRRIVETLGVAAARILFVSDVVKELDAAREAGLRTLLCVRPPASVPTSNAYDRVKSFDTITS